MAYADFVSAWRAQGNWMLVIAPPKAGWPLDGDEFAARGDLYASLGKPDLAAGDYQAALKAAAQEPSPLFVKLGNAYRDMHSTGLAEDAYRRAIEADANNARAYNNLAWLLAERSNNLTEAVALARQAIVLSPADPLALDTLGFALFQQGDFKHAAEFLEQARAKAENLDTETRTEIGIRLATAYLRDGQGQLAEQVVRDLLKIASRRRLPKELQALIPRDAQRH